MKEFEEDVKVAMQDDDLKEAYDHFLDYGDGMREDGFKEGFEQGKKESFIELAKLMLNNGEDHQKIEEYTGLSIEEIQDLIGE